METVVREELERLVRYARVVGAQARQAPAADTDELSSGRAYIGGALTTLLNLGLISDHEFDEWWQRATRELPPVRSVGG